MGSRKRKPGRNSPWSRETWERYRDQVTDAIFNREVSPTQQEYDDQLRLSIERMDYQHYDEHLQRVRSHPKNLLRLSNRRLSEARESQRDINNGERYKSAVKRSLFRRSIVDWRTISDED